MQEAHVQLDVVESVRILVRVVVEMPPLVRGIVAVLVHSVVILLVKTVVPAPVNRLVLIVVALRLHALITVQQLAPTLRVAETALLLAFRRVR